MKLLVCGIWLVLLGVVDLKFKEIPVVILFIGGGLGLIFCYMEERTITNVMLSCLPGIVTLLFSWMSKEVIGYGDGIVLLGLGMYMPLSNILSVGILAFCLAGVVALVLLVIFCKKGNYRIPFIPFLAMAYVITQGGF